MIDFQSNRKQNSSNVEIGNETKHGCFRNIEETNKTNNQKGNMVTVVDFWWNVVQGKKGKVKDKSKR